jgi:hypothetical protein
MTRCTGRPSRTAPSALCAAGIGIAARRYPSMFARAPGLGCCRASHSGKAARPRQGEAEARDETVGKCGTGEAGCAHASVCSALVHGRTRVHRWPSIIERPKLSTERCAPFLFRLFVNLYKRLKPLSGLGLRGAIALFCPVITSFLSSNTSFLSTLPIF